MGRLAQTLGLTAMKLQTSTAAEYKKEFSPCFRHHVNERSRLEIHQVHVVLTPGVSRFLNNESEVAGLESRLVFSIQHKGSALAAHRTRASQFVVGPSRRCAAPRGQSNGVARVVPWRTHSLGGPRCAPERSANAKFRHRSVGSKNTIYRPKSLLQLANAVWPNHSLNRTLCGGPRLAIISFLAKPGPPQSAG